MTREPDELYPPDVEVVTNDMKASRGRAFIGTALVTFGSGLMLERTLNNDVDYFWLAIGLGLLAAWLQVPRFPWFAVGSIMTGFATGGFIQSLISAPFESTIGFLFAAAGFFAVYARYPRVAKWAIIPAAIFALFAVGATGVELIGLIPSGITTVMLPLLLIAGGALLLFRNSLPRGVVKCGLIALAITFVGSAASTVDKWESNHDFNFSPPFGMETYTSPLPDLDGRQLVVETEAGEINVITTDDDRGMVTARSSFGAHRDIRIETEDDVVRVALRGDSRGPFRTMDRGASWIVVVPGDSLVRVATTAGLVKATVDGIDLDVTTTAGAVQADVDGHDGSLTVKTEVGSVQVNARTAIDLRASTDVGLIVVDGHRCDSPCEQSNDGPDVDITTGVGQITVVPEAA